MGSVYVEWSSALGNVNGAASWVVELLLISGDESDDENVFMTTGIMVDIIDMLIHTNRSFTPLFTLIWHSPLYIQCGPN